MDSWMDRWIDKYKDGWLDIGINGQMDGLDRYRDDGWILLIDG